MEVHALKTLHNIYIYKTLKTKQGIVQLSINLMSSGLIVLSLSFVRDQIVTILIILSIS